MPVFGGMPAASEPQDLAALQARIDGLEAAALGSGAVTQLIEARQQQLNAQAAEVQAEIAQLTTLSQAYQNAVTNSVSDRQALHTQLDQLTQAVNDRLSSLESKVAAWKAPIDLTSRVVALEAATVVAFHVVAAIPTTIALGASLDVPVTWPQPFADDKYTVDAPQLPLNLLGKATATVKSKSQTGCVVTVKALGLLIATGTSLDILAYRHG